MEDKTLSGYEKLEGSDYEITGNSTLLCNSETSLSFQKELTSDHIFLEDFPEEEIFVLSEEYVLMEEEYVMWTGAACFKSKSMGKHIKEDDEGQLMLPFEDSVQHLGEYFSLKNADRSISDN